MLFIAKHIERAKMLVEREAHNLQQGGEAQLFSTHYSRVSTRPQLAPFMWLCTTWIPTAQRMKLLDTMCMHGKGHAV